MEWPGPYGWTEKDVRELEARYFEHFGEKITLSTSDRRALRLASRAVGFAFYCLSQDVIDRVRRELREYLEAKRRSG